MRIIKKLNHSVPRAGAHAGSGERKLYISNGELENQDFQAMTHGFLPGKSKFAWHHHDGIEEVMLVLRGEGIVRDRDGEYAYSQGDLFIYPQKVDHEIENPTDDEHEYIFVRIKA
jgi:mannose-6-phosphate isomerase-like protein (cupin superfamily)